MTDTDRLDMVERIGVYVRYEVESDDYAVYNGYTHERNELGRAKNLRDALDQAAERLV